MAEAEVAVIEVEGRTIEIRKANPQEVEEFVTGGMVEVESPEEITRRMVSQVLASGSFEEALATSDVKSLKREFLDRPFTILDASWYKSSFQDGPPMFVVLDVADSDGILHKVSTGSVMPMANIYAAQKRGDLSTIRVKAVERERETSNGYHPINLVRAD